MLRPREAGRPGSGTGGRPRGSDGESVVGTSSVGLDQARCFIVGQGCSWGGTVQRLQCSPLGAPVLIAPSRRLEVPMSVRLPSLGAARCPGRLTVSLLAVTLLSAASASAQRPPQRVTRLPRLPAGAVASTPAQARSKGIWEPVNYAEDVELNDVFFASADEGWASGGTTVIIGTCSWAIRNPPTGRRPCCDSSTSAPAGRSGPAPATASCCTPAMARTGSLRAPSVRMPATTCSRLRPTGSCSKGTASA